MCAYIDSHIYDVFLHENFTCIHTCIHTYKQKYLITYTLARAHTHAHARAHRHMYTYIFIYLHATYYMYTYTHVCMHTYTRTQWMQSQWLEGDRVLILHAMESVLAWPLQMAQHLKFYISRGERACGWKRGAVSAWVRETIAGGRGLVAVGVGALIGLSSEGWGGWGTVPWSHAWGRASAVSGSGLGSSR